MSRVKFITHEGKTLLHLDFTNAKTDEALAVIAEAKPLIAQQPPKSVRTLTDVTGIRFNTEVAEAMKHFTKTNEPYVCAAAVVGLSGIMKVIYDAVVKFSGRNLQTFPDLSSAKAWLARQA